MSRPRYTRRAFLGRMGIGVAGAVAGGYGLTVWGAQDRHAQAASLARGALGKGARDRTLVVLELGGGNDGLNTVVPHASGPYHDLRPTLAVRNPIDLDGEVGFHPNLPKLAQRYRSGQVAIIEGLGYDAPDLSHFGSSAIWWSARGGTGGGGWIGAYLDGTVGFDDPLAAIGIGATVSPAIFGQRSFATTIADASGLEPSPPAWAGGADRLVQAWSELAPDEADPRSTFDRVRQAFGLTSVARAELDRALPDLAASVDSRGAERRAASYEQSTIADSLDLAATLIRSPARPRVIYVNGVGDFDTHQGQATRHADLMTELDAGLDRFFTVLGRDATHVTVATVSEFGRRPAENGTGTDHGSANTHFVIGQGVRGGRYGEQPSLTALDGTRNMVRTADFRSLYATLLSGWLGVEHEPILGEPFETFPVFA
jgi:uncharacterized protein (DUF1501 family)